MKFTELSYTVGPIVVELSQFQMIIFLRKIFSSLQLYILIYLWQMLFLFLFFWWMKEGMKFTESPVHCRPGRGVVTLATAASNDSPPGPPTARGGLEKRVNLEFEEKRALISASLHGIMNTPPLPQSRHARICIQQWMIP